ncbi:hypothetical protein D9613_011065 [Agrocybe pediades]|uniref:Uncharacterized protein n=1 Tax=Agrocybe pediades TaxID=84607 RepID=A0A8H4QLG5_9AGAR|nr:hypothetical protein D9613_011065 [Agrocybe pediades]
MLLKLIPAHTEPTIHFSLSFADLPPGLPTPAAWTAQLAQLMLEDLEVPATLHSLDRAVGVSSLLEEVELDIALGEVRCRFIDGKVESWGFWEGVTSSSICQWDGSAYGKRLTNALESIIRDVNESTLEDERAARERELEKEKADSRRRSMSVSTTTSGAKSSAPNGKVSRHKKQRSFFMQIVSCVGSIINLTGPSSPTASRFNTFSSASNSTQHQAYSVTYNRPPSVPATSTRARSLRRAARSALVDTYRLFVLSQLIHRLPGPVLEENGGQLIKSVSSSSTAHRPDPVNFTVWILHSIRRRALERMEQILQEAELEFKSRNAELNGRTSFSNDPSRGLVATTMEVPLSFSDDEEDTVDRSSTSSSAVPELDSRMEVDSDSDDGSSLHTPTSASHQHAWPAPAIQSGSDISSITSSNASQTSLTRPPVPPKDINRTGVAKARNSSMFNAVPVPAPSPTQHLSPAALHEYTDLLDLRTRLRQLLLFAASQSRVISEEKRTRLEVLAVKSRRRAWSNKALSLVAKSRSGLGGQEAYGLATAFRSSPLAKYMWTAEDLEKGSVSQNSSPASTISSRSSSLRSSLRPRLRPKIQYDLESLMMPEVNAEPFVGENSRVEDGSFFDSDDEPMAFAEMKESIGRSSLGLGVPKRHRTARKVAVSSRPFPEKNASIIGRLFPVSEERVAEVQDHYPAEEDEVYHFSSRSRSSMSDSINRTFMGCDEIKVNGEEEGTYGSARETQIQLGFTEFGDRQIPSDIDPEAESALEVRVVERAPIPRSTPRARTTSMMGALLQRAKSSLQSNKDKEARPELSKKSLLCQPVASSVLNQTASPAPKLQMQSQLRLKRSASNSSDNRVRKAGKIPRPDPPSYEEVEVNMELELRVGDQSSLEYLGIQELAQSVPTDPENEKIEFTLAMDVPKTTRRRRGASMYSARPLSKHNLRPNVDSIFP